MRRSAERIKQPGLFGYPAVWDEQANGDAVLLCAPAPCAHDALSVHFEDIHGLPEQVRLFF
ncbi:hypothetical protein BN136_34 [Cronobacter universalis NCTC 9529]|nr:hypothetical protein BN136_34 [Cronobacter universalis NCTC 9529]